MSLEQDRGPADRCAAIGPATLPSPERDFDAVYQQHCDFVWRSLRRLGLAEDELPDATQEVFLSVFRYWDRFEQRASLRTWLFAIARGVARDHRRASRRRTAQSLDARWVDVRSRPLDEVETREAARLVSALLEKLSEPKRLVFVLAELEQLPLPEVAEMLGINLNTAYSRLRAARQQFEAALGRHRAKQGARARKDGPKHGA
jgi:RNA polymerase sigma-70 factor (ECF subfamily)